MASAGLSIEQLMRNGPKPASEVVRESFKTDLKEAAMLDYIPRRDAAVSYSSSVPIVGTFGTWYVSKPVDFIVPEPQPKMDAYMKSAI
eukprot:CAMPEP_0113823274 /NCGR_PEP_ID=MMETSP0328-20130328/2660_1 /TAXON_ID=39455 /ORGANISM="Alexandrium minutum" /LENGTH=87 /DNA_ID=CAMNT_0000791213 /DNA_START=96 /DNA_END=359 /DNA_ORIENTATION=- /assembly_acc=CAM_ASM_000350